MPLDDRFSPSEYAGASPPPYLPFFSIQHDKTLQYNKCCCVQYAKSLHLMPSYINVPRPEMVIKPYRQVGLHKQLVRLEVMCPQLSQLYV